MKITIVTTIAQYFEGAEIHFRNLRWAFGEKAKIIINHFKCNKMPNLENAIFNQVDSNPNEFYFFWNKIENILYDDSDFFVFTEQDIFITEKPKFQNAIKLSFISDYLCIFNNNYKKLYPRIWEGYTFIPGWIVRKAINENVSLGNHISKSLDWNLKNLYTKFGKWIPLEKYIKTEGKLLHEGHFDTLFEFSLFCFINKIKWFETCIDSYHISSDAVHFRGIDRLCFDYPNYHDLDIFFQKKLYLNEIYKKMINDCACLLLLSGVYKKSEKIKKIICFDLNRKKLFFKLKNLKIHSKEWMTVEEIKSLNWMINVLNEKKYFI